MSKKPKVSVLVPIYNVEKYLPTCLNTLIKQTLHDIEVICINDGSTDDCPSILKKYAAKDNRIIIITKPNSGYGDSMNIGLKKATGEYIGILESDDYLDSDALSTLYNLAKKTDADIVRANYYHHLSGKDIKQEAIPSKLSGKTIDPTKNHFMLLQPPAIWSSIYRRQFLIDNKIQFLPTPGASYQDTGFHFKVWATAKRATFTDKAFLHYRLDNESSSVNNPGKVFCVCDEFAEIERYLKENGLQTKLNGVFQRAKFGSYLWNIDRLSPPLAKKFIARMQKEYRSADLDRSFFSNKQWHMLQLIIKAPPSVYYTLYRLKHMI